MDSDCPSGWHLPTIDDWYTLIGYLGGGKYAGGKMKEVGTEHWYSPNKGADNSSSFSAIPCGFRKDWMFFGKGAFCGWWSGSDNDTEGTATGPLLYHNLSIVDQHYSIKAKALGVRCIKN